MGKKEPLYPHVSETKEPLYPHLSALERAKAVVAKLSPPPAHIISSGEIADWVKDSAIKFPLYHGTGAVAPHLLLRGFSYEASKWGPFGPGVFFAPSIDQASNWDGIVFKCWVRVRNLFVLDVSDSKSMENYRRIIGGGNKYFYQWERQRITTDVKDKGYDALELKMNPSKLSVEEKKGGTEELLGCEDQFIIFDPKNIRIEKVVQEAAWVKKKLPTGTPDWAYACVHNG